MFTLLDINLLFPLSSFIFIQPIFYLLRIHNIDTIKAIETVEGHTGTKGPFISQTNITWLNFVSNFIWSNGKGPSTKTSLPLSRCNILTMNPNFIPLTLLNTH